jgi:hypothetical protein
MRNENAVIDPGPAHDLSACSQTEYSGLDLARTDHADRQVRRRHPILTDTRGPSLLIGGGGVAEIENQVGMSRMFMTMLALTVTPRTKGAIDIGEVLVHTSPPDESC